MKLYEYEATEIFKKHGIPTIDGVVIQKSDEIPSDTFPIVLKAQVLSGGRGKAGGIKFAQNLDEAKQKAQELLSKNIKGYPVKKLFIRKSLDIEKEYYLGFTIDRSSKRMILIFSTEGGVDIEETAREDPEKVLRIPLGQEGITEEIIEKILSTDPKLEKTQLRKILYGLFELMDSEDADLAEINPLGLTPQGLIALDAKITIDDNSLFRHPNLQDIRANEEEDEKNISERKACEKDLAYVELDGDVGVIGCGAGLVMATLDLINENGGNPACFLDLGGGASTEKTKAGLDIVLKNPKIKSIIINAFCGITRCDELAQGIIDYETKTPLSIRMTGTKDKEGIKILKEKGFNVYTSMEEAIKKAVQLAK